MCPVTILATHSGKVGRPGRKEASAGTAGGNFRAGRTQFICVIRWLIGTLVRHKIPLTLDSGRDEISLSLFHSWVVPLLLESVTAGQPTAIA